MKTKLPLLALTLGMLLSFGLSSAQAQYGGGIPGRRPTVSPYLNLLRGGATALNYYNLVKPTVDLSNSIQQVQNQVGQVQSQQLANMQYVNTQLAPTGKRAGFMTQGSFFMTNGAGGGPNRRFGLGGVQMNFQQTGNFMVPNNLGVPLEVPSTIP